MARKKNNKASKNDKQEEFYLIKVPVHLAFMYEEKDSLFFSNKYDMINFVKDKIDSYKEPVIVRTRNKTKTTVISTINYKELSIGDTPILLLTIEAFDTNVSGKYLEQEANRKVDITPNHKLGSDNNVFMIYPVIKGLSARRGSTESNVVTSASSAYRFRPAERNFRRVTTLKSKKVINYSRGLWIDIPIFYN